MENESFSFDPTTDFVLALKEREQWLNAYELRLREKAERFKAAHERSGRPYSVVRTLSCAMSGNRLDGIEGEVNHELARRMGMAPDPSKPWIPFDVLYAKRVMLTGGSTDGANIVGETMSPAVDVLQAASVVRLGAQTFPGLRGDVPVPQVGTAATAAWVSEAGTAALSEFALAQTVGAPKRVTGIMPVSKQLLDQSPEVGERVIRGHLMGLIGAGIDAAALAGTGGDGPTGILNVSGVTVVSGASFSYAKSQAALKAVASAKTNDEAIRFLAAPAVRETLAQRAIGTAVDNQFIWQRNAVADKPAFVSANAPSATLYCADFSGLWILLWGGGIQVQINPYAAFKSDIVHVKASAFVDVVVARPQAFHVSTAVT